MSQQTPVDTAPTTAEKRANGVGLAALIVGGVTFVMAVIPVLSFIAWLPAIAAIVLGIVGLILKGRKRLFAWLGIALGVVAWIIAIIVSVASLAAVGGAINDAIATSTFTPPAVVEESSTAAAAEPAVTPAPAAPAVPADYQSALKQATQYSDLLHLSKQGIYDQLTADVGGQFSAEAAQYAVDNLQADYSANALAQAKQYQETMAMSPEAIRDQLTSEYGGKFTQEEADFAVANLNS